MENMVLYAQDIMKQYTTMLSGELSVLEASKIMASDQVGFVIIQIDGDPVGIVTEWDLINNVVSKEVDTRKVKLKDIMKQNMISVAPDTPTDKVADMMNRNGIRRIPVISNGRLLGVITSRDILRVFKEYMESLSQIIDRFGNL